MSGPLTVARVLALQRAAGNHAVAGALRGGGAGRGVAVSRFREDIGPETFTDENLTAADKTKSKKGQMSEAFPVTYSGTVHPGKGGERDQIEPDQGKFEGYFKADRDTETMTANRGIKYAGMPIDKPEYGKRNVATYELSKLLGEPIIPPTYAAKASGMTGYVLQEAKGVEGNKPGAAQHLQDPVVRRALSNLYMLDVICGQVDRHPGNYVIELEAGKPVGVKGIDNDLSFGKKYEGIKFGDIDPGGKFRKGQFRFVAGQYVQDLAEIDRTYAERIISLAAAPEAIRTALVQLLSEEEIASTLKRLKSLADFLQPLMGKTDGPVKTEWK